MYQIKLIRPYISSSVNHFHALETLILIFSCNLEIECRFLYIVAGLLWYKKTNSLYGTPLRNSNIWKSNTLCSFQGNSLDELFPMGSVSLPPLISDARTEEASDALNIPKLSHKFSTDYNLVTSVAHFLQLFNRS